MKYRLYIKHVHSPTHTSISVTVSHIQKINRITFIAFRGAKSAVYPSSTAQASCTMLVKSSILLFASLATSALAQDHVTGLVESITSIATDAVSRGSSEGVAAASTAVSDVSGVVSSASSEGHAVASTAVSEHSSGASRVSSEAVAAASTAVSDGKSFLHTKTFDSDDSTDSVPAATTGSAASANSISQTTTSVSGSSSTGTAASAASTAASQTGNGAVATGVPVGGAIVVGGLVGLLI